MNLIGKIFTVLIFLMSVAFMMLSVTVYATHRNWRDMVLAPETGLKAQIEQQHEVNQRLNTEIQRAKDRLALEQTARRFALASLESQLEAATRQLQARETELSNIQAAHIVMTENLETNQNTLAALTVEVEGLRNDIRQARQARDNTFLEVVDISNRLNAIEGLRTQLAERRDQLMAQVSRMQNVLSRNELTEFTPVDNIPPAVRGIVTAVGETDLIEISIGSDDGIRSGHTLDVYRNNAYLGRIVVQHTEPDKAVGKILPEFKKGIIKKGDRVATKLS